MNLVELYPSSFDGSFEDYRAFMRSVLIKGSFDGMLKKLTGYKGMYLCQQPTECWTLKFDQFEGIFGMVLAEVRDGFGRFHLYYFPNLEEALLDKFSLSEALVAHDKDYREKIRSFALYPELFGQFYIASLSLHVNFATHALLLFYETFLRDRVYAKEGVLSYDKRYVVEPEGLDKDLPSFRLLLPLMNFLNTTLSRIATEAPSYFELFKKREQSMMYNGKGVFTCKEDAPTLKLFIALGYGDDSFDDSMEQLLMGRHVEVIHERMSLNAFLQKAPWYDLSETPLGNVARTTGRGVKPKMVVVTGFLGSGKTNFLQNYIEYETEKNRFVGIIQNEIGKTGLDGKLVDYDYSLVEMDEGCVCCSLAGQLRAGVNTLMSKTYPDTILLETTGVANPFNLLSELHELEDVVELEAIVTVVDGSTLFDLAGEYTIFLDQIRAADVILLNKIDRMSEAEMVKVEQFLYENNRCAKVIRTTQCDVHPHVLELSLHASTAQIASLVAEEDEVIHTHLHDNISSLKLSVPRSLCKEKFEAYLNHLPSTIVRVKGIVRFENESTQSVVQYVNGTYEFVPQHEDQVHEMFLVFIGKNLDKMYLQAPV
ncbi:CobW family GTP-binding protein [Sulfurospirillum barnesii]|uniref:Putative GTPase, G3E family n=1 Tax=Sulfurospirillum barnesii (strain ATCC 700032 / DSM 10660 / SES-3) TaxID=760154 RepID=I3Y026_SULBS|nr:GTP-binding protein [Sulfurospirillum barnesii]AFL69550.1 putative GTPase, G3E family [Sulfurospirillum barnesii SES-3]